MHISCPQCNQTINAKDQNLFGIWDCPKCEWRFRGVHADQPCVLNLFWEVVFPFNHGPQINDLAECPHCSSLVDLNWIYSNGKGRTFGPYPNKGYNGPYVCKRCCRKLPWDYPHQKSHVAENHNKSLKNTDKSSDVSPAKLSDWAQQLYKKKHNI